jgi:predicted CoA-binding protein
MSVADTKRIFDETKTIALVGASMNPARDSNRVGWFLTQVGKSVWGVNPGAEGQILFNNPVVRSLEALPAEAGDIQMVDIFRRSEHAGAVVDRALSELSERGLRTIWMQLGVVDAAAADRAKAQGVRVVMDACPMIAWRNVSHGPKRRRKHR